jgi:hypothetical protein
MKTTNTGRAPITRTTHSLSRVAFRKLSMAFAYERPKVTTGLPEIQRKEGQQDVLDYIEREFVHD